METMQCLLEGIREFHPKTIKSGRILPSACLIWDQPRRPEVYQAILITAQAETARLLAQEEDCCVFWLGGEDHVRFADASAGVVCFPEGTDPAALQAAVLQILPAMQRSASARQKLWECFDTRGDLSALTRLAEELLDHPLAVFDAANAPLEMGPRFRSLGDDAALNEYQEKGYISYSFAEKNSYRRFLDTLERAGGPFTFSHESPAILPRRVHRIYLGSVPVAHCSMVLNDEQDLSDDEVLRFFSRLVGMILERGSYHARSSGSDPVLRDLLSGACRTEYTLREYVKFHTLKDTGNFYVFNIPRRRPGGREDPADHAIPSILLREICYHLPVRAVSLRHLVEPERILLLVDAERGGEVERTREKLDSFFRMRGLLCAVSCRFTGLEELPRHVEQTQRLTELGRGEESGLLDGNRLFFRRVMGGLRLERAEDYCLPELLELLREDQEGAELLRSVYAYLDCGRSAKETADRLGIHRNTLPRRLTRFQELTGLDLSRGDDASKIYLSCKLLEETGRSR